PRAHRHPSHPHCYAENRVPRSDRSLPLSSARCCAFHRSHPPPPRTAHPPSSVRPPPPGLHPPPPDIRHLPSGPGPPPPGIRHPPSALCLPPPDICHPPFLLPHSPFRIPPSAFFEGFRAFAAAPGSWPT